MEEINHYKKLVFASALTFIDMSAAVILFHDQILLAWTITSGLFVQVYIVAMHFINSLFLIFKNKEKI